MQSASQVVQIDSIKSRTVLDKKATVAIGNIVKQRDTLSAILQDQSALVDSLRLQVRKSTEAYQSLQESHAALRMAYRAQEIEIRESRGKYDLKEELMQVKLKALRSKRINIGPYAGYGFTASGVGPSAGIGISYTLIRL